MTRGKPHVYPGPKNNDISTLQESLSEVCLDSPLLALESIHWYYDSINLAICKTSHILPTKMKVTCWLLWLCWHNASLIYYLPVLWVGDRKFIKSCKCYWMTDVSHATGLDSNSHQLHYPHVEYDVKKYSVQNTNSMKWDSVPSITGIAKGRPGRAFAQPSPRSAQPSTTCAQPSKTARL